MEYDIKIWKGEKLGKEIAVDTETNIAPFHSREHKMITCQVYDGSGIVYFVERNNVRKFFNIHRKSYLVMQNAPFDIGVLSKITGKSYFYEWYDNNLIRDTKVLYKLYSLAVLGIVDYQSSLKYICKKLLNVDLDKNEEVRCNFEQFENYSVGDIPEKFLRYAAEDAIHTYNVYCKLLALIKPHDKYNTLLSHNIQVKGDLALNNVYKNGIGVDLLAVSTKVAELNNEMDIYRKRLATWGYVQGKPGINDRYEMIMDKIGLKDKLPVSGTSGKLSSKTSDLEKYSKYPFVSDYLKFNSLYKLSTFLRDIKEDVIHPQYNTILNTGRVSCRNPNIMQIPREGGIRECFVPKSKDKEFYIIDYSGMENAMLAQVLLDKYGESEMANVLNEGKDIHRYFASILFNKDEEEVTKEERQEAKACYSADTELLTKSGWVRIDKLNNTATEIAQYNPHSKEISFTKPLGWYSKGVNEVYNLKTKNEDTLVSGDHRMLTISEATGYVVEKLAKDYGNTTDAFCSVHGGKLKNIKSEIDTRIAVMVQADGSYKSNKGRCELGFSKKRKINRCRELLIKRGIPFKEGVYKNGNNGFTTNFSFKLSDYTPLLDENKNFLNYLEYDFDSFCDELPKWDGRTSAKHTYTYSNTSYKDLEVAQTILSCNGYKANISKSYTSYKLLWYVGDFKKNPDRLRLTNISSNVHREVVQRVYCPSVPTTWVLTRRNGKIVVHGNCVFGYPGGLGVETFLSFAKGYGLDLSIQDAEHMKQKYFEAFPEMRKYLSDCEEGDVFTLTGRKRGNAKYCAVANTPFQGLGADMAKIALYELEKSGFEIVAFIHDEVILEVPKNTDKFDLACKIMINAGKIVAPDLKIGVEGGKHNKWVKD